MPANQNILIGLYEVNKAKIYAVQNSVRPNNLMLGFCNKLITLHQEQLFQHL